MIPKLFQNDPKLIPKWYQNDPKMIPKWSQNDPKIIRKWSQNYPKMIPNWSQNDTNMIPKWAQNDSKMIPKWSVNYPKMISKWFQNLFTIALVIERKKLAPEARKQTRASESFKMRSTNQFYVSPLFCWWSLIIFSFGISHARLFELVGVALG